GIPKTIQADERKLKQILYNLLSNAVKFTPDAGHILLSAERVFDTEKQFQDLSASGLNYIQISVEDSGIGLNQEDLERIFHPFEQVDNSASRRFPGTGLGLSLTKSLVELHGGKIWAESEGEGKGTTFSFCIPV
ncbi:MAG: ATP-binding protein, partial [Desulfobacterales bacterium]